MENKSDDQKILVKDVKSTCDTLSAKNFSILPDLATGWRPKILKIHPPILIKYKQSYTNNLITNLTTEKLLQYTQIKSHKNNNQFNKTNQNQNKPNIVYLGPRHYNSFSFHNKVPHQYHVRFQVKNSQLPENFQQEIQKYQKQENRPFVGMNPSFVKNNPNITFESNFQSGNLDLVVQINPNSYDLFLRPDTNTCGHTQWFYFKINVKKQSQKNPNEKKILKFNICNNKKWKTLYGKGMKPYVYSNKLKQQKNIGWQQSGNNVSYKRYVNKYVFNNEQEKNQEKEVQNSNIKQNNTHNGNNSNENQTSNNNQKHTNNSPQQVIYFCLSFEYQLQFEQDTIQFAYCPPYTYSNLKKDLSKLKKKASQQKNLQILEQRLCISLSGLEIPLLTITNNQQKEQDQQNGIPRINEKQRNKHKKIFVATARIHPGQSNGSHVMNGLLNYITSPQASKLRDKCIFKIIPMLNPDGVILGNFRTGLAGKDLNRQFKVKNLQLLPQISSLKEYITKLKFQNGSSIIYYLDLHGHSTKKNIFAYGPEYDLWDNKYERCKIFPKILSFKSPMFKLNSCVFKIANYKKSTARAFVLGFIPFCYTIQSSIGFYIDQNGQNMKFTIQKWQQVGKKIGQALEISLDRLNQQKLNLMVKKNKQKKSLVLKQIDLQNNSRTSSQVNTLRNQSSSKQIITNSQLTSSSQVGSQQNIQPIAFNKITKPLDISCSLNLSLDQSINQNNLNKKYLQPIKHFKIKQKQIFLDFPKINEQNKQSDGQSDGKSDCQSQTNDFDKNQYESISKDIMRIIKDFQQVVGLNKGFDKMSDKKVNKVVICKKKVKAKRKQSSTSHSKNQLLKNSLKVNSFQQMKLVPSLKHKLNKIMLNVHLPTTNEKQSKNKNKRNLSQKKINYNSTSMSFQRSFIAGKGV